MLVTYEREYFYFRKKKKKQTKECSLLLKIDTHISGIEISYL